MEEMSIVLFQNDRETFENKFEEEMQRNLSRILSGKAHTVFYLKALHVCAFAFKKARVMFAELLNLLNMIFSMHPTCTEI